MITHVNDNWIHYAKNLIWDINNQKDFGKWIVYYKSIDYAAKIISTLFKDNIIAYAKHTKGDNGMLCLYVSGLDIGAHHKVIAFLKVNKLIPLTNKLNYSDICFKFNGQSFSKQYAPCFPNLIKLSSLINLTNGDELLITTEQLVTIDTIEKNSVFHEHSIISNITNTLERHFCDKYTKVFTTDIMATDINQKIIDLAPSYYNIYTLFKTSNINQFISIIAHLLSFSVHENIITSKLLTNISSRGSSIYHVFYNLIYSNNVISNKRQITYNQTLAINSISYFNHNSLNELDTKIISYLIYVCLFKTDKGILEAIIAVHNNKI